MFFNLYVCNVSFKKAKTIRSSNKLFNTENIREKNTEVASLTPVSDKIEYEVYAKKLVFMN